MIETRSSLLLRFLGLCVGLVLLGAGVGPPAAAQAPMELPRLDGPVTLDGRSTEPAWQDIEPLPLTMYQPTHGGEIRERTEIRVAYDDEHLYVSGRLYDSNPDGIRANSLYRDRYSGDDTFAIILDPFNDHENALWLFTTPTGVRFDMAVSNDAEGGFGGTVNDNWDTFWSAEAVQTDEGWFAEMRIPLSSLGFQADGDRVTMGLSTYRYIARRNERYTFPDIPPKWGLGFAKPSQAQDVVLRDVESTRPVYVTPYVLGGLDREARRTADGTEYRHAQSVTREVGADLRYNVTNNLTLDLTANTDFAQVEADPQRVNLTRFSLFFPEKRRFFQKRASTFAFNTGGNDRLFNSRRIGLVEGEPVRIYGGARLVGRVGDWDVGVLNMQTAAAEGRGAPAENFGVTRVRRRVFNSTSYAGGIVTTRLGRDGSYNVGYGLDGVFRLAGDEYLTLKGAQTVDRALVRDRGFDPGAATLGLLRWERRRSDGLHYEGTATRAGADYRPDVGFITRRDFTELEGEVAYGWFPSGETSLRTLTPEWEGSVAFRNADRSLQSARLEHAWEAERNDGRTVDVYGTMRTEDLREPLSFPENTTVPTGRYTFYGVGVRHGPPDGQLLRVGADLSLGGFYDGRRWQAELSPTWNLSRHLELGGTYQLNLVRFPDRGEEFAAHVARTRVRLAFNKKISTNAFLQYNSAARVGTADVRFRYNFGQGHDLWIVYNEGLNLDRARTTPALPRTDARSLLVKYNHTFQW
ncbi:MAG: DUF5916 domain-containing protein [Salinivenus sp.]